MLPADWRKRFSGVCERDRLLAPFTTWRIGGPAELYVEPASVEELADTLEQLRRIGLPYRVLGGGSNLLVADTGVRGAVLSLSRFDRIERSGDRVRVEAGVRLATLVNRVGVWNLSGVEPLAGIPGRVGGAIFGNAGGRLGDIGSLVTELELLEPNGSVRIFRPPAGFFAYRRSTVGRRIVLAATLQLEDADQGEVYARSRSIILDRLSSQPGWVGNAGCVFKNPDGDSAGRLIDSADCRNMRVNAARVSDKHANFIENDGGASAEDVLRLLEKVRDTVRRVHGVDLEIEVRRWL